MGMSLNPYIRVAALLVTVAAAGCASDPIQLENEPTPSAVNAAAHPAVGEVFQLRPGEVASLAEGTVLVTFHNVRQDSRCPSDVTCVWEGDAEMNIGVALEGGVWSWSILHTTLEPWSREIGDLLLVVEDLEPAPRSNTSIPPSAYTVSLRVTRR